MTRHQLRLATPAANFYGTFLLGNGSLGAAVHGRLGTERIDLNLDTLWSGGPTRHDVEKVDDRHATLQELRRAIGEKRFEDADDLARRLQGPGWTQSYQPLGAVEWSYSRDEAEASEWGAGVYERVLDLSTATSVQSSRFLDGETTVTSFVSAPDGVIVLEAVGATLPTSKAVLRCPHPVTRTDLSSDMGTLQVWSGRAPALVVPPYVDVSDESAVVYGDDSPDDEGRVSAGMGFAVAVLTQDSADGRSRMLVSATDGFRGRTSRPSADLASLEEEAIRIVHAAAARTTVDLRQRHEADHRPLFERVDLDLSSHENASDSRVSAAQAELFFDLGRYLLIASSRPGSQPATLQGLWNEDVRPGWSCNYTTNINVQMNYWGAHSTGLGDLAEPLERFVAELAIPGSASAREFYDARGWTVHHNTDLWGFSAPVLGDPQWSNWPLGGAWLLAHLREHEAFAPDADFRRVVLWPVSAGAAAFLLDLLVEDPDGHLSTSPSTSPEHRFRGSSGRLVAVSAGTAMDLTLVRETLESVVGLAREFGHVELAAESESALARLRPLASDQAGRLLEWAEDREPEDRGHRHLSHLYGLHPGSSIDEVATPVLYEQARRALVDRIDNGSGHTGWSQAWILCLAARTRNAGLVEESLDILVNRLTSESLLDLHPVEDHVTGYRFQIDGNFGASAGIAEALLQSQNGVLRLFNALPESWKTGSVRGLRGRGGYGIDLTWSPDNFTATVRCAAGGVTTVCLPEGGQAVSSGRAFTAVPAPNGRQRISWDAAPGETVVLSQRRP